MDLEPQEVLNDVPEGFMFHLWREMGCQAPVIIQFSTLLEAVIIQISLVFV